MRRRRSGKRAFYNVGKDVNALIKAIENETGPNPKTQTRNLQQERDRIALEFKATERDIDG